MATATAFANANTVVATGWTNPTNAYADDTSFATAAPAKSTSITTDYGFAGLGIPTDATVESVTFEFLYKSSTTSSTGAVIGLQGNDNGSLMGSETTYGMSLSEVTQTRQYTTGLPSVANLNAADTVRARVRGFRSSSNTAITWSVDYVKITVVYHIDVTANVTGVRPTPQVGVASAAGGALVDVTGVRPTPQVGEATAGGSVQADVVGIQPATQAGAATASGGAQADVTGSRPAPQVGVATGAGGALVDVSGASSATQVGVAAATGGATAGVSAATAVVQQGVATVDVDGGDEAGEYVGLHRMGMRIGMGF